jgi:hypothetical protein
MTDDQHFARLTPWQRRFTQALLANDEQACFAVLYDKEAPPSQRIAFFVAETLIAEYFVQQARLDELEASVRQLQALHASCSEQE